MASEVPYYKSTCKSHQCHIFYQFTKQSQNGFACNETHDSAKCNKETSSTYYSATTTTATTTVPKEIQYQLHQHTDDELWSSMECIRETSNLSAWQTFNKHRWKCGTDNSDHLQWKCCCRKQESVKHKTQGLYQHEWLTGYDQPDIDAQTQNIISKPFVRSQRSAATVSNININNELHQCNAIANESPASSSQSNRKCSNCGEYQPEEVHEQCNNSKTETIPENETKCCQNKYRSDSLKSQCNVNSLCCRNGCFVPVNYKYFNRGIIDCLTNVNGNTNDNSNNNMSREADCWKWNVQKTQSIFREPLSVLYIKDTITTSSISLFNELHKFIRAILPILLLFNMLPLLYAECDQTFVSRIGGPQNGTFTAPILHNPTNHSRQCLYIFLAGPGQRVEVLFTSFNLRGTPPDGAAVGEIPACGAEYMDIYAEVQSSDPADLINSPFGGRYCGPIPPRRRISLFRAVALSFYTSKSATTAELFGGRYSFINASVFEIGTPVSGSACSFTITPHKNKSDIFISPTYPGAYPKDLSCSYQFIGEASQRVRLEFRDFDLFFGGPHCPFDFVKVYDGADNTSALIGTYCGQQRNLVLYSSESSLLVHFFTLQRTAHTQNRGFKGIYEFSESFVKLDFIHENNGMHIRGSECDQKILSKKESSGLVYSPNYPFPYLPKTVCRYFVYGMQDAQHLERVRLEFQIFEIQKGEHKDVNKETNCTDGYLKIFLKGQETQDAYDKFDYELCGYDIPHVVVSDGPRLAMVFSSGELQARGFKAKYTFETEYKIPGTAAPDGSCSFTYRSTSRKKGEFNSPRYPSNYPSDTNCSYMFLATPNEQVTIVFDHFKVKADNANATGGAYGIPVCFEDWLEMYVIFRDGSDRFLGRYCGLTAPGPVESPRGAVGIRIVLHTDSENVASGFKARYIFEVAKSVFGDCGGNFSGQDSGVIISPNYPAKYDGPGKGLASRACNWYLNVRNGYKIAMNFEMFSVEGDPAGRGCPAAVLRIWNAPDSEQAPTELCGEKPIVENWHYMSLGQSSRISFTTTDKTIGAAGFRIIWTAVQDLTPGPPSSIVHHCESSFLFQCEVTGYCIAEKLRCDKTKNCGPGDDTDEMHCTIEVVEDGYGNLLMPSLVASSFLICLLFILCHCKRKRIRHHRQLGLHRNAHYDSTTSATGLSSSRRHLQGGGSLSGSLRGINSDILPIPPAPLPPTSVPPHICISGDLMDDDDDMHDDLFMNGDRFSSGDSV